MYYIQHGYILSIQAFPLSKEYADICEDEKQLMYTRCSYVYPSGSRCTNPIPQHLYPPLCGGHCDSVEPPKLEEMANTGNSTTSVTEKDISGTELVAAVDSNRTIITDHKTST
jgi:hypothetical protein